MMGGPMPRLRLFALVLLAAAAVGALLPSGPAIGDRSTSPGEGVKSAFADEVAAGQAVYSARCASCHGSEGQGTALGPPLIGVGAAAADFQLRTGRMPFSGAP